MAAPSDPAHIDDAVRRYLAGEPESQIVATTGISRSVLHRERTRRGIPPRSRHHLPDAEIVEAYRGGESEYSIARRLSVSRAVIGKRLDEQGVQRRSMSAAGKTRAASLTPEQRAGQAAAAHAAVRGTKVPLDRLVASAASREQKGRIGSDGEQFLFDRLVERGLQPIPQKAIGKYNVDLAVPPIAVEVLGGGWHATKQSHAHRTPEILNAGWHLLFVWDHEGDSAISVQAADYLVSWLQEVGGKPPTRGEYRVISGGGKFLAAGGPDDDQFTLVPPPRGSLDPRP
jgi:very-short-patch-repair endonuclease